MASQFDYQSCRYSSWCPDRYDADDFYEALDRQYMDAPLSRYSMQMPPSLNEDEPMYAPAALGVMPAASADMEASTLSTSPFDWRELEASCRKLDQANIRITDLDITCMGSPSYDDNHGHASSNGQVRYGITCERTASAAASGGSAFGFPPANRLPNSAAHHHMPVHQSARRTAPHMAPHYEYPPRPHPLGMAPSNAPFPVQYPANGSNGTSSVTTSSGSGSSDSFPRPRTASSSTSSLSTGASGGSGGEEGASANGEAAASTGDFAAGVASPTGTDDSKATTSIASGSTFNGDTISATTSNASVRTSSSNGNAGNKSFGRVIRAIAERCHRVFGAAPKRSLRMTAATVKHRRCNSSERLEQLGRTLVA